MQQPDVAQFREQTIQSQRAFEGRLLKLRVDTVRLPDGGTSTREVVEHPGAVAVLPLTDDGEVLLVRQWRHSIGQVTLEIPAGTLKPGEEPLVCVERELAEETGTRAARIEHLTDLFVALGYSDELIRIYLGTELSATPGSPDEDEKVESVRVPLADAVQMCLSGEIRDSKSVVALLMASMRRSGGTPDAGEV
jgi:ADP-ribose pyrophosphatase